MLRTSPITLFASVALAVLTIWLTSRAKSLEQDLDSNSSQHHAKSLGFEDVNQSHLPYAALLDHASGFQNRAGTHPGARHFRPHVL